MLAVTGTNIALFFLPGKNLTLLVLKCACDLLAQASVKEVFADTVRLSVRCGGTHQ